MEQNEGAFRPRVHVRRDFDVHWIKADEGRRQPRKVHCGRAIVRLVREEEASHHRVRTGCEDIHRGVENL